jgi:hypothetical protein
MDTLNSDLAPASTTARKSISWLIAKVFSRRLDECFSPFQWTCAVSPELKFWALMPEVQDMS